MKTYTMMVVDDSNVIRRKIMRVNQDTEFEVVGCACSGQEAVESFQDLNPDVVTMDLTMPQMDGIECISRLKAMKPEIRILVVSALSDKATGIEALERGAQGFLCKPFDDEAIYNALSDLMEDAHV